MGRVWVDGAPACSAQDQVDPETAAITINGEPMLYRPVYLGDAEQACWVSLRHGGRTGDHGAGFAPPELRRQNLFARGNAGNDTEGLLLLTNEGALAHHLLSPRHHVDKEYFVRVAGRLTEEDCRAFSAGMVLQDGLVCQPAELKILTAGNGSEACVTLPGGQVPPGKANAGCPGDPGGISGEDSNGQSVPGPVTFTGELSLFDRL